MLRLDDPERVDDAGDVFSRYGSALKRGHGRPAGEWAAEDAVPCACAGAALYRRAALRRIGGFDDGFESYLEDVDLGLRAQLAGWECLYAPRAVVLHAGGGSQLPRRRYVRLMTANRGATIFKNVPGALLLRHARTWLWGQWYFLVAYRHPGQSLLGYWDLVRRLPALWRARRIIQGGRRMPVAVFDRLLGRQLGEPPLRHLLRHRLGRA
jgi:GT2 family glycosyltransferase